MSRAAPAQWSAARRVMDYVADVEFPADSFVAGAHREVVLVAAKDERADELRALVASWGGKVETEASRL